ncbi:hypothetical protein EDB86DRAFT_3102773 [Lactarius hatsudake]|nr:hypothetical protein EDB86DRAFT_3102773 [Lactarius hatsudake]
MSRKFSPTSRAIFHITTVRLLSAELPQPLPRRAAVAHDRNHDGCEHAAGNELGFCPSHIARRCLEFSPHASPPPRKPRPTAMPSRHARPATTPTLTRRDATQSCPHGRLQPDDFGTATTMATMAGIDGSKDDDDNIDDTRPATTMVTNARLTTSWALARGSKLRKSPPLPPHHLYPSPVHQHHHPVMARKTRRRTPSRHARPTTTPSPDAVRKICYDANPLPANPAVTPPKHSTQDPATVQVRHHVSRKPRREANAALKTPPPLTCSNTVSTALETTPARRAKASR